jgi:histidinol dehydrogenase
MKILTPDHPGYAAWRASARRIAAPRSDVQNAVTKILDAVRKRGDAAVREFTQRFDRCQLSSLRVFDAPPKPEPRVQQALESAHQNILQFARGNLPRSWQTRNHEGAFVGEQYRPFDRVGIYVPGGSAPLVSTALMTVTLAKAAGVPNIVVVTPPPINPVLHFAILMAGGTEIYQVGGAQAIGALAFGTNSIEQVQKIVGPGNRFVTEAKRQVLGYVAIDQLPGPSEVMVIADSTADPRFVAADLLAQAEHGPDSVAVMVTSSLDVLEKVEVELNVQLAGLARQDILIESLSECAALVLVQDIATAVEIANDFAPEHLSLQVRNPRALLSDIRSSGAVFLGPYSPVAAGDFVAGPSHTLPTGGAGKCFSGLTVSEFFRRTSVIEYSPSSLKRTLETILQFAEAEQLDAHGKSALVRFEK